MRVLQIISGFEINGAVIYCRKLSEYLARRGHQVVLLHRPDAWIATLPAQQGITNMASTLRRFPTRELRRIRREALNLGIDVIHTHMSKAHFFGVLLHALSGIPCVATAHSQLFQLHWMFNDRVIAVSQRAAEYHRRVNWVSSRRITVIPTFVETDRFSGRDQVLRREVRQSLGLGENTPVIGTVGVLIERKGIVPLIRALSHLRKTVDARLMLVGPSDVDYSPVIDKEIQALGIQDAIHFVGRQTDVRPYLSAMDVYANSAIQENMPVSILEAMAMGLPVVASDVGGARECIDEGVHGLVVPPGDDVALGDALKRLCGDPTFLQRAGTAAQERARREFSMDVVGLRIEAVLQTASKMRGFRAAPNGK